MITHIKGKLVEKNPTDVVVETNGLGYFVNVSLHTYSEIKDEENIMLYTYLQVKEDSHSLYGFKSKIEREIFLLLISVSGIGANTARTMLSSLTPNQIRDGIATENVSLIQSVKGIGLKTAQRVIIDLKDKVIKIFGVDEEISSLGNNTQKVEALSALEVLGFAKKQAEKVLDKIVITSPEASLEDLIKEALKLL
jgi:holliday junction DNA helicase RuvA